MSSTRGRPPDVTASEVLGLLDDLPEPVITSRDVADECGCSTDTARRKLNALEQEGVLASKTFGARSKGWYRPDWESRAPDEVVIPFPVRRQMFVVNPTSETLDILTSVGRKLATRGPAYLFSFSDPRFDDFEYTSAEELRADLEQIMPSAEDLIDDIVDRWWGMTGIVVRDSTAFDNPVFETQTAETTADFRDQLPDTYIIAEPGATTTVVADDDVLQAIRAAQSLSQVSDYREIRRKRHEFLQPVLNGDIEGLPNGVRLIGVDDTPAIHCFERATRTIFVVEHQEVTYRHTLSSGDSLSTWLEFVDDETDRAWVETAVDR